MTMTSCGERGCLELCSQVLSQILQKFCRYSGGLLALLAVGRVLPESEESSLKNCSNFPDSFLMFF